MSQGEGATGSYGDQVSPCVGWLSQAATLYPGGCFMDSSPSMGDILGKFAEDLQLGRLKDVWDVQNFLAQGKDDLFQVASE